MSAEARSWLPADTLAPPALSAGLDALVAAWSRHWFEGRVRIATPLARAALGRAWRLDGAAWHVLDQEVALGVPASAGPAFAAEAIGLCALATATPADTDLLVRVWEDCLADLRSRVAGFLDAPATAPWQRTDLLPAELRADFHALTIEGSGDAQLMLRFGAARYARLVRAALPPPPAQAPLASRSRPLADLRVPVAAFVGRSHLTLAELQDLEAGDVVVLDRPLDEPLALTVAGELAPRGRCRVEQEAQGIALRIVTPLNG